MSTQKLFLCVLITLIMATPAWAVINLQANGSGDYPTIQAALNVAPDFETIILSDGVYSGPGNTGLEFYSNVTLRSEDGYWGCIIDCEGTSAAFLLTEESGGTIFGLTVRNAQAARGAVAFTGYGSYIFEECLFMDNHATDRGGVWHGEDGANVNFRNCLFSHNTAENKGGALSGSTDVGLTVQGCTFVRSAATEGGAIYLDGDATADVTNTIIAWSLRGGAFDGYYYADVDFSCSDLFGNQGGDWVNGATGLGSNGNISADPLFADPMAAQPNLLLSLNSPCSEFATGCGRMGPLPRIQSSEACYGVRDDGQGMFPNIQAAVDYVPSGQVVLLDDGIYTGTGNNEINPAGKACVIRSRSGVPEDCILDLEPAVNASAFVLENNEDGFSVQGLSVQNALVTAGAMIEAGDIADVSFTNCLFRSNRFADTGYFLEWVGQGHLTFTDSDITENISYSDDAMIRVRGPYDEQAAILEFQSGSLSRNEVPHEGTLLQVRFGDVRMNDFGLALNTTGEGGYVMLEDCAVNLGASQVMSNTTAGMGFHLKECSGQVLNSRFRSNISEVSGGGLAIERSDILLQGCLFELNEAEGNGGAVVVWANDGIEVEKWVDFEYCEFVSNRAGHNGGGLYAGANGQDLISPMDEQILNVRVDHCTFHDNRAEEGGSGPFDDDPAQVFGSEAGMFGCGELFMDLDYCLITAGDECYGVVRDGGDITINTCNINGNDLGDWDQWWLAELLEYEENLSEYPYYCDSLDGDLSLNAISPCLPDNNIAAVQYGANGVGCYGAVDVPEGTILPRRSRITGNAPNPFNPRTTLHYELAGTQEVSVLVYDLAGHLVRTLVQAEVQAAGAQRVVWDGTDNANRKVGTGIYLARLVVGGHQSTHKMVLLK